MGGDYCSAKGFAHAAVRVQNPDWVICPYCSQPLPPSADGDDDITYIDLTGDESLIEESDPPPPSRHRSAPALIVPGPGLQKAVHIGKEQRALSASATRKKKTNGTLYTLSITLFTAKYTEENNGGLISRRYWKGYPKILKKHSSVIFDVPTKQFPTHAALLSAIMTAATKDEGIRAEEWEVIASASVGHPSSICHFSSRAYETVSLMELLESMNVKLTEPYQFSMSFLFAFPGDEDEDDLDLPGESTTLTRQKKASKEKVEMASTKRKASASPSIKRENIKKEKTARAQAKTKQVKEEESIKVEIRPKLADTQKNKDEQERNTASSSDLSVPVASNNSDGGEDQNKDDSIEGRESDGEQGRAKKNTVPFTTSTRKVNRSG